jgi:hypothetical protein
MRTIQRIRQLRINLAEEESDLLKLFEKRISIPIDEVADKIDTVKRLISSGHLQLEVTSYPWGTEFRVCQSLGSTRRGSSMEGPIKPAEATHVQQLPISVSIGQNSVRVPTARLNEASRIIREYHEREAYTARMAIFVRRV